MGQPTATCLLHCAIDPNAEERNTGVVHANIVSTGSRPVRRHPNLPIIKIRGGISALNSNMHSTPHLSGSPGHEEFAEGIMDHLRGAGGRGVLHKQQQNIGLATMLQCCAQSPEHLSLLGMK